MARTATALIAGLLLAGSITATHGADISKGSQSYALHCVSCHGPAGQGVFPGTPRFNRGERLLQSDLQLLATIRGGKNAMPPFNGVLRDREILDVIAYLRTLQR